MQGTPEGLPVLNKKYLRCTEAAKAPAKAPKAPQGALLLGTARRLAQTSSLTRGSLLPATGIARYISFRRMSKIIVLSVFLPWTASFGH
jgi:hypothetical protein